MKKELSHEAGERVLSCKGINKKADLVHLLSSG